jgi:hypothetical protein
MPSDARLAAGRPRVFLSLTSPASPTQAAFVTSLIAAIASHDMTPVRVNNGLLSSPAPLEPIRQLMETCCGTIVVAMARTHVVEGIAFADGRDSQRYRDRYLATEWVQIEGALAYQLGHPILVLKEDLVHPAGLLDPAASGLTVSTFSLRGSGTADVPQIADRLLAFRARLTTHSGQVPHGR